jgi:hypothetical protein
MKQLNFFPHYRPYLEAGSKTTTLRLNNNDNLQARESVSIAVGWGATDRVVLFPAIITAVRHIKVGDLDTRALAGESPDCREREAARLVLSTIYHRVVTDQDSVYVIHFERHR